MRLFDGVELGELSPLDRPLALIEDTSIATRLTCNFVGTTGELDTGIRVEVELVSAHPDGHFTEPGEFESAITIGLTAAVGTGRGTLRAQLDDERGMTLEVTIRALTSLAVPPRDGEFLEIRDRVAAYLIDRLN